MNARDHERSPDRTFVALFGITVVAVVARVVFLGTRIAHWDEGRVGYDVLRYAKTGLWEYRPVVHGPFLPHVNKHVFSVLGPDDFSARLIVAVVGGLLPLAIWLYRDHLRDGEMVVAALFLAADPLLLYYSRFMRNDVLVAGFAFVGIGMYLRYHASARTRYLYAGTASWALAFTAKENAPLYVLSILAGLVLLLDHRLLLARSEGRKWTTAVSGHLDSARRWLGRHKLPIAIAAVEFLAIIVYFYAPRAPPGGGIGLWNAVQQPATIPAVLEEATIGSARKLVDSWVHGDLSDNSYLPFLSHYVDVLARASGALALLAAVGFVSDRYAGERPRDVVALAFYWGVAGLFGFPLATSIQSPWTVINTVVPFVIPAAVGAMLVVDWAVDAYRTEDEVGVVLAVVVVLLVVGQVGATAVSTSYVEYQSEENVLAQWAQPAGDMRPALDDVRDAAAENEGIDVLWYGSEFVVENESRLYRPPVNGRCEDRVGEPRICWYDRLPLPWYLESFDANVSSVGNTTGFDAVAADDPPPVIITNPQEAGAIEPRLDDYEKSVYLGRLHTMEYTFYVHEKYAG